MGAIGLGTGPYTVKSATSLLLQEKPFRSTSVTDDVQSERSDTPAALDL